MTRGGGQLNTGTEAIAEAFAVLAAITGRQKSQQQCAAQCPAGEANSGAAGAAAKAGPAAAGPTATLLAASRVLAAAAYEQPGFPELAKQHLGPALLLHAIRVAGEAQAATAADLSDAPPEGGEAAAAPSRTDDDEEDPHEELLSNLSEALAACSGGCGRGAQLRTYALADGRLRVKLIEMDYVDGGLGWRVWAAALILADRIAQRGLGESSSQAGAALGGMPLAGARVLELGAGCGLAGLAAAALGGPRSVTMTDFLPAVCHNLAASAEALTGRPAAAHLQEGEGEGAEADGAASTSGSESEPEDSGDGPNGQNGPRGPSRCRGPSPVHVRWLDWREEQAMGEAERAGLPPPLLEEEASASPAGSPREGPPIPRLRPDEQFDVIIGSDILYDWPHAALLPAVLRRRLSSPAGAFWLVLAVREPAMLRAFLSNCAEVGLVSAGPPVAVHRTDDEVDGDAVQSAGAYEGGFVEVVLRWRQREA